MVQNLSKDVPLYCDLVNVKATAWVTSISYSSHPSVTPCALHLCFSTYLFRFLPLMCHAAVVYCMQICLLYVQYQMHSGNSCSARLEVLIFKFIFNVRKSNWENTLATDFKLFGVFDDISFLSCHDENSLWFFKHFFHFNLKVEAHCWPRRQKLCSFLII